MIVGCCKDEGEREGNDDSRKDKEQAIHEVHEGSIDCQAKDKLNHGVNQQAHDGNHQSKEGNHEILAIPLGNTHLRINS